MAMTRRRFLENAGSICPHCGNLDVHDEDYIWADGTFVIDQSCNECDAEWQVLATINEYTNLEAPDDWP